MRTYDFDLVQKAISQYREEIVGLDLKSWLLDNRNVALTNENNDVAMFQRQYLNPISVYGHYFFWSRGKQAVQAGQEFLKEVFSEPYSVQMITGLTPVYHKGALWMNKRLGFEQFDMIETAAGPCYLVMLTKNKWMNKDH